MRDDGRAAAADVLRHPDSSALDLRRPGFTPELLNGFYDLIDAGRTDRMAARFQTAASGDRNASVDSDFPVQTQARRLPPFHKTTGFERQR